VEDKQVKYITSLKINHKKNLENFKSDYALLISKELSYIKQLEKAMEFLNRNKTKKTEFNKTVRTSVMENKP
jgi:hypothetical protein